MTIGGRDNYCSNCCDDMLHCEFSVIELEQQKSSSACIAIAHVIQDIIVLIIRCFKSPPSNLAKQFTCLL